MKRFGLSVCALLVLAACGGTRETPPREVSGVAGVRGFLKAAFASDERPQSVAGGGLCGDPQLVGEPVGAVSGSGVCGIENAVRLRAVGDVQLTQAALINCETARALRQWVETGAKPAIGKTGGGLSGIRVAAHYACRTRNNQPGAKVSEHGKGRAIDISALRLADGSEISVLEHWGGGKKGRALREMHSAACGPFGTVLGPNADRHHKDHFHFDTASYRSGSYCR